jgi:arylsulfatase A-like enzyme
MNARRLLTLTLFFLAACGGSDAKKKPNVILITLDTTRADYLSCYGYKDKTTPNLDQLASEGTRFDMAISTAAVTPVSHAAILTGLDNNEHGLRVLVSSGGFRLPKDVPTLATVLQKQGYHTLAVHSAFPVSRFFGFMKGFDVFEDLDTKMFKNSTKNVLSWNVQNFQRRSDETKSIVEKDLDSAKSPFFLWVHLWDPHDWEKHPPDEYMPPKEKLYDANGDPIRPGVDLYACEIKYMDAQLGELFAWLKAKGMYDDTLIFVVADHGQGLMEHGWAAHRLLYQEQVHVPLIAKVPGVEQRREVSDLVRTIDIYPTVLDYLGVKPPRPVTGRSLRPLIESKEDAPRVAFADQINGYDKNAGMVDQRPLDDFLYMAMDGKWKLIYRPNHPEQSELYDVVADPDEAKNLYASEPAQALRLRKLLAEHRPWVVGQFPPIKDEDDREAASQILNAIGYTGGDTVDANWAWTCPEHMDQRWSIEPNQISRCPLCKSLPILIKK